MARQTTNYGLTKPDYTDIADIEVVNANMDIIDGALKVIDTKSNNVMSKNSSAWSSTVAYAVGQYCIYNNSLWKCLVQHSGQTPQEGTYWARVSLDTLGSEINALNNNFDNSIYCGNSKITFDGGGDSAVLSHNKNLDNPSNYMCFVFPNRARTEETITSTALLIAKVSMTDSNTCSVIAFMLQSSIAWAKGTFDVNYLIVKIK